MTAAVTVIVPTFDHGPTLRHALDSILAQTLTDFSLIVIGDGAPASTQAIVAEYAARDRRVAYRWFSKGRRTGEEHRHVVLGDAKTPLVAYCSDDDLWFPDHLETLAELLGANDFVTTRPLNLVRSRREAEREALAAGSLHEERLPSRRKRLYRLRTHANRFEDENGRALCFGDPPRNIAGLTTVAHTLAAYRRLPEGWSPAPPGLYTDLNMWRKFLRDPDCRVYTDHRMTALHLPASHRRDMTADERLRELALWAGLLQAPGTIDTLRRLVAPENPLPVIETFPQTRPFA